MFDVTNHAHALSIRSPEVRALSSDADALFALHNLPYVRQISVSPSDLYKVFFATMDATPPEEVEFFCLQIRETTGPGVSERIIWTNYIHLFIFSLYIDFCFCLFILSFLFDALLQLETANDRSIVAILMEYLRSLNDDHIPIEHFILDLIIKSLVHCPHFRTFVLYIVFPPSRNSLFNVSPNLNLNLNLYPNRIPATYLQIRCSTTAITSCTSFCNIM